MYRRKSQSALTATMLAAVLIVFATQAAVSEAAEESVTVMHDGLTLRGTLHSVGDKSPEHIILMVHGTLAHSGMEIMETFQARLGELGISSLAVTLSLGVDDRTGMFKCGDPHRHRHTDAVGEIAAWFKWLEQTGYSRISLLGHSRGGNQAALFAGDEGIDRAASLILIAPMVFNSEHVAETYEQSHGTSLSKLIGEMKNRNLEANPETLVNVPGFLHCRDSVVNPQAFLSYYDPDYEADTSQILARLALPVLVILGTDDALTTGLAERIPAREGIEVFTIEGADHFFRDLYADEGAEAIAEFLENTVYSP